MTLKFTGKSIPGTHGPILVGKPETRIRRVKFSQLKGEGEIVDQPGGRTLTVDVIVHNHYSSHRNLDSALKTLDKLIGENGTLEVTGNTRQTFKFCTLAGKDPIPFGANNGPLPDEEGMLEDPPDFGAWFQHFRFTFRQLLVE